VEGLLDREESLQCQAHLENLRGLPGRAPAISSLQRQLAARGPTTAESVTGQSGDAAGSGNANRTRKRYDYDKIIHTLGIRAGRCRRCGCHYSDCLFLVFPKAQATAAEVMTKGAQAVAKLTTIHLRGQLRTLPADNFSYINADCPFNTIEFLETIRSGLEMARRKAPARLSSWDGQSAVNAHQKLRPCMQSSPKHDQARLTPIGCSKSPISATTITNELKQCHCRGWK